MRVVGGAWRGCVLQAPTGRNTTRPTTDRVREAVASCVLSAFGLDLSEEHILDAFAGSGALGIELLSRGAASVFFCDSDYKAISCIKANLKATKVVSDRFCVLQSDVVAAAQKGKLGDRPFSCVLLDPPYKTPADKLDAFIADLIATGSLAQECYVLYEHAKGTDGLKLPELELVKAKKYGAILVDLYKRR